MCVEVTLLTIVMSSLLSPSSSQSSASPPALPLHEDCSPATYPETQVKQPSAAPVIEDPAAPPLASDALVPSRRGLHTSARLAILVELTEPWAERMEAAYEQKRERHADLSAMMTYLSSQQDGLRSFFEKEGCEGCAPLVAVRILTF
ncbi:hypothetical protein DPX16_4685 [Anabarilius grahami]|uniref:Uncharacterized protein n=1 Tax=Anabarilius grahami TaxID=495550 RepID=A0A3N0YGX1_ANAGA|nr:hypothetical protein DPX16_4685 [Anabarilius grahami]